MATHYDCLSATFMHYDSKIYGLCLILHAAKMQHSNRSSTSCVVAVLQACVVFGPARRVSPLIFRRNKALAVDAVRRELVSGSFTLFYREKQGGTADFTYSEGSAHGKTGFRQYVTP
jgi:hypothetical protein